MEGGERERVLLNGDHEGPEDDSGRGRERGREGERERERERRKWKKR